MGDYLCYLGSAMPFSLSLSYLSLMLSSRSTTVPTGARAELTTLGVLGATLRTDFFFVCHCSDSYSLKTHI